MFKRVLAISLSPNTQIDDVFLAIKTIFSPWILRKNDFIKELESWFVTNLSVSHAFAFCTGRDGLLAILIACKIGEEDEVILQGFTCVAVPNAIIAVGAKPIYVDIDNSYTLDAKNLQNKITKKTKAIIAQHTFGIPADLDKIKKIVQNKNILIIEDCAHVIGGRYKGKMLGTIGDAAFFSFGRDKAFSSVSGGIVVTKNTNIAQNLATIKKRINRPSIAYTLQSLLHPIIFFIAIAFYDFFGLGKVVVIFFQKVKLLNFPVSELEKKGIVENRLVRNISNSLSALALLQLSKIEAYNKKRQEISNFYHDELNRLSIPHHFDREVVYLRFPLQVKDKNEVLELARKNKIYLGNWYENVVDPKGVNKNAIFYKAGTCPYAESIGKQIINLPTYPRMSRDDVLCIVNFIKKYVRN